MLPRPEALPGQGVPLHVLHPRLDLPLRLRPVGPVGPRREAVKRGEVGVRRVPDDPVPPGLGIPPVAQHRRPRVVHDDLRRHAAEMLEGALVALEHGTQPLVREGLGVRPAGVT